MIQEDKKWLQSRSGEGKRLIINMTERKENTLVYLEGSRGANTPRYLGWHHNLLPTAAGYPLLCVS